MDILFARLKQYSIGVIVFGIFLLISIIFIILGSCQVFYSPYDPNYDNSNDLVVAPNVPGLMSNYISYVIFVVSISIFALLLVFWLFFAISSLVLCTKLDKKIEIHSTRSSILNFFTLFVGSILLLGTCNALLNNRINDEYIIETEEF